MGRRGRELIWAGTIGLVLADSSVVTLALPEILARFETTVFSVSWVLTAFNAVLALGVLPAARLASRGSASASHVWAGAVLLFAGGSLVCALAPSAAVLVAGRCVQALGGAGVIAGAIELLARSRGSHTRGAAAWGAAGLVGIAVGPAAGGFVTELVSWEAIFALQVPVALLAVVAAKAPDTTAELERAGRSGLGPEVALGLVSAGLTGALFLLVIMLTEGWGHSPLEAALIVSVMPAATMLVRTGSRRLGDSRATMAAGAVALAGGLAALALLPGAEPAWTLAPQVLIGAGIALSVPGLTARALSAGDPAGRRAAGTIAARHVGIVLGLLVLTPLFAAELGEQQRAAERAGAALILDAGLPPSTKIALGAAIGEQAERAEGRLTDLSPAFAAVSPPPEDRAEYVRLQARLADEVDKAATAAFSTVFLVAAALALLAVVPIAVGPGAYASRRRRSVAALISVVVASVALAGVYLAEGGATYEPLALADPCRTRPAQRLQGSEQVLQRIALSALDGAACRLRVTREELVLALADPQSRREFAQEHGIGDEVLEEAVRAGLGRAVEDAERVGAISPLEALLLDRARGAVPVGTLIDALQSATGASALELLTDLLRRPG